MTLALRSTHRPAEDSIRYVRSALEEWESLISTVAKLIDTPAALSCPGELEDLARKLSVARSAILDLSQTIGETSHVG